MDEEEKRERRDRLERLNGALSKAIAYLIDARADADSVQFLPGILDEMIGSLREWSDEYIPELIASYAPQGRVMRETDIFKRPPPLIIYRATGDTTDTQ